MSKPATTLNTFKSFVRARDLVGIARDYREYRDTVGLSDREIYRIALAAEPELPRDEWDDVVKTALEKHPDDARVWLDLSDLSGDAEPVTLDSLIRENAECPLDSAELAALRALRVGETASLGIGGGSATVARIDPKKLPLKS